MLNVENPDPKTLKRIKNLFKSLNPPEVMTKENADRLTGQELKDYGKDYLTKTHKYCQNMILIVCIALAIIMISIHLFSK